MFVPRKGLSPLRNASMLLCLLTIGLALALTTPAARAEDASVEGEVLIAFRADLTEAQRADFRARHGLAEPRQGRTRRHPHCTLARCQSGGRSTAALIALLQADSRVARVEPNYKRHFYARPDDPDFDQLWAFENTGQLVNGITGTSGADIEFLRALWLDAGSTDEVVVAIVDSGVDIEHPDLAANIWVNPGETPGNGIDDDGNGYIDDVNGYDFASNTGVMTDSGDHGTHVAGIAGAVANNGIGVTGTCPHVKLLPLKVSDNGDDFYTDSIIDAADYVADLRARGVNVVAFNASYGGESFSSFEEDAMETLGNAGVIVCAAAGNESANNDTVNSYPANYALPNIISVAASNSDNQLASFSNYGITEVDLAAPGDEIYSTLPLSLAGGIASVNLGGTSYEAQALEFSAFTGDSGLSGTLYDCGIGDTGDFPAAVAGDIALIERGSLYFSEKVANAMNAGAIAAVIYDNTSDPLSDTNGWTLGGAGDWIPAIQITRADGLALLASTPATATVTSAQNDSSAYQFISGTSMATPMVTGAVAFAARNFPGDSVAERVARILDNVTPVAALTSRVRTGGVLNLRRIADSDLDDLPDWWELNYFGSLDSTDTDDNDHDGQDNAREYLAVTNPASANSRIALNDFAAQSTVDGDVMTLTVDTASGRDYAIEWSENLQADSWNLLSAAITGNGNPAQFTDPDFAHATQRFYRLIVTETE